MINCLIIEDEKAAQDVLLEYINKTPFIECMGVYESGVDVPVKFLEKSSVLFLDIELPELSGLSYLKSITNPPKVVVCSAYSHYAVEAFESCVLDYLVKPFSFERFFKAVSRVRNQLQIENNEHSKELFLYADKTLHRVLIDEILYLKAEVDYVNVVTKKENILILDSLRNWEEKLSIYGFIRVHRSFIINKNKVEKISGNQVYINSQSIPIGKVYKDAFLKLIKTE